MSDESTEVHIGILRETDLAFQVTDGETTAWLPKSQIEEEIGLNVGEDTTITIPEWLALEKDLI